MKPKKRKLYVITYNSGDLIKVGCKTINWKVALEYYRLLKKNKQRQSYDALKKAEEKGDFVSLDVIEDYKDGLMPVYKTIYRKDVKA